MKKEQIKQAAAEFSKTRTMPPEGKRLYSFEELQAFAIAIHDQAVMGALIKARDDVRTPRSVLDGIRAMQINNPFPKVKS